MHNNLHRLHVVLRFTGEIQVLGRSMDYWTGDIKVGKSAQVPGLTIGGELSPPTSFPYIHAHARQNEPVPHLSARLHFGVLSEVYRVRLS